MHGMSNTTQVKVLDFWTAKSWAGCWYKESWCARSPLGHISDVPLSGETSDDLVALGFERVGRTHPKPRPGWEYAVARGATARGFAGSCKKSWVVLMGRKVAS